MRAKLVVMLMALGLFLATATAHASLIDLTVFTTEVQMSLQKVQKRLYGA